MKKLIFALAMFTVLSGTYVKAATGSYDSTYSMTGGLVCREISHPETPTYDVTLTPTSQHYETLLLEVNLQKKGIFWSSVASYDLYDSTGGTASGLKGDGEGRYRIYLYHPSNQYTAGDITVEWSD